MAKSPEAGKANDRRYTALGATVEAPGLTPGLYLVATPIGNLRDITLRALETLAAADVIACEDTRVSHKLMERYGIAASLTSYHDHNAESARPALLARLMAGASVALISDAGTPLISDPGFKLVRAAQEAGVAVIPIPGPSSLLAALTASGLPSDRFFFEGFLPPKSAARLERIAALARIPGSLVLFETGPRLADALADLAQALGPRAAAVCRELTKLHEDVRTSDLASLAQDYAGQTPRGEIVIVIAPPPEEERPDGETIDAMLRRALDRLSVKDAVAEIVTATGLPRREIYQRALELANDTNAG